MQRLCIITTQQLPALSLLTPSSSPFKNQVGSIQHFGQVNVGIHDVSFRQMII
ncbi:hypothetical protein [Chryseobacterium culicis]|uniref:hypothetical protein n=1 Tax=Chryseobacterium culicis TaxID=680127 RepID=UPI0028979084|nr:hypothetical protein [Chryseobacterium culicis]